MKLYTLHRNITVEISSIHHKYTQESVYCEIYQNTIFAYLYYCNSQQIKMSNSFESRLEWC